MKTTRADSSSSQRRHRREVMTSTPATAETVKSAPSTTRSARERVGDEARVAGRVEDVELVALVLGVQQRARDRHRPPLLVVVVVGDGAAVGHGSQARDRARLEEQRLRERRLAASAVADERDVANLLGRERHHRLLPESTGSRR